MRTHTIAALLITCVASVGCDQPDATSVEEPTPGSPTQAVPRTDPTAEDVTTAKERARDILPVSATKWRSIANQSLAETERPPGDGSTCAATSMPEGGIARTQSALLGINACWAWYGHPLFWQGVWAIQELREDGWKYFQNEAACKSALRNLTVLGATLAWSPQFWAIAVLSYTAGSCACERAL